MNESGSQIVALTLAAALLGAGGMALWKKHLEEERTSYNSLQKEVGRLDQRWDENLRQRDDWVARVEREVQNRITQIEQALPTKRGDVIY